MGKIYITGGNRLDGSLKIQGSKNSALPILAACAMIDGEVVLHNCPMLTDVRAAMKILKHLGCGVRVCGETVTVDSSSIKGFDIPERLMHEMRSSIIFMGALLSRHGKAVLSSPGGCEIGLRPIDLHISSLEQLGAQIYEEYGRIYCKAKKLRGSRVTLSFPSVGATENIMLTAVAAVGVTTIINAAREPEIVDLAGFLNSCGAKISGAGEGTVTIVGTGKLKGCEYTVMPDRIAASTYMAAAAVTGGCVCVKNVLPIHIAPVIPVFEQMGCEVSCGTGEVCVSAPERLSNFTTVRTMPYPGFPTDSQANVMAMAAAARGTSVIIENIFESRYKHAVQLNRMGAKISVEGRVAVIQGVDSLFGAGVEATDLRGDAAVVVAALAAHGVTTVESASHIDRGYTEFENSLKSLGAEIYRE